MWTHLGGGPDDPIERAMPRDPRAPGCTTRTSRSPGPRTSAARRRRHPDPWRRCREHSVSPLRIVRRTPPQRARGERRHPGASRRTSVRHPRSPPRSTPCWGSGRGAWTARAGPRRMHAATQRIVQPTPRSAHPSCALGSGSSGTTITGFGRHATRRAGADPDPPATPRHGHHDAPPRARDTPTPAHSESNRSAHNAWCVCTNHGTPRHGHRRTHAVLRRVRTSAAQAHNAASWIHTFIRFQQVNSTHHAGPKGPHRARRATDAVYDAQVSQTP